MGDETGCAGDGDRAGTGAEGTTKRAALLRQITEEGGFAFVSSVEKAAAGDIRAAEAAREMAWEQLHSGPWSEVVPAWRDAYAMACLHVADIKSSGGHKHEALRTLDMGLIMGGPLLRAELDAAISRISAAPSHGQEPASTGSESGSNAGLDATMWEEGLCRNKDPEEALRILPRKSLSCKRVERRPLISFETFISDYFLRQIPVIITGCMEQWPACTKWKDINYLKQIAGDRTIPVEVGKNYVCTEWKQELISFSKFLDRIGSHNCPENTTYLAQHPLFDQIRELKKDILVPDYCYAGGGELKSLNAWFGPIGTVTPLHHDPHHNIFAQVVGRKYIRLYPASYSNELYPHEESMLFNTSRVDLDHIDTETFPKIEDLEFLDCILDEGEMLYIPQKWWHYVRSLSTSFSISFWWSAAATAEAK